MSSLFTDTIIVALSACPGSGHYASSSEFKMIPMLLFVNTSFAHSGDTVNSSIKIRMLLKF
jgi:hypothetical protein